MSLKLWGGLGSVVGEVMVGGRVVLCCGEFG